jgi:hypothetical protein
MTASVKGITKWYRSYSTIHYVPQLAAQAMKNASGVSTITAVVPIVRFATRNGCMRWLKRGGS